MLFHCLFIFPGFWCCVGLSTMHNIYFIIPFLTFYHTESIQITKRMENASIALQSGLGYVNRASRHPIFPEWSSWIRPIIFLLNNNHWIWILHQLKCILYLTKMLMGSTELLSLLPENPASLPNWASHSLTFVVRLT